MAGWHDLLCPINHPGLLTATACVTSAPALINALGRHDTGVLVGGSII